MNSRFVRNPKTQSWAMRGFAGFMAGVMIFTTMAIPQSAQANGPTQPETHSFEPIGTTQMVDPFSGNFTYNIPLLTVDGYPVNLAYHSGITMDQEASWTGLGWNLNVGAITRGVRGLPDDFKGEAVVTEQNMKPNKTYGGGFGAGGEIFGIDNLKVTGSLGVNYNNYTGVGTEFSISPSYSLAAGGSGKLGLGLGLTSNSNTGLSIQPSVSYSYQLDKAEKENATLNGKVGIGATFNSRAGLQSVSVDASLTTEQGLGKVNKDGDERTTDQSIGLASANFDMMQPTYTPKVSLSTKSTNVSGRFTTGLALFGGHPLAFINGYYSKQELKENTKSNPAYGYLNSDEGQKYDNSLMDFNRENDGGFTENTPALPVTNFTYDVMSVNGQGVGGSYRPFRSEIGYVFDSKSSNESNSTSVGVELGFGNFNHTGGQVAVVDVHSTSGKWAYQNEAAPELQYRSDKPYLDYERYYMKEASDRSVVSDDDFYASMGGSEAVRLQLDPAVKFNTRVKKVLEDDNSNQYPINKNYRDAREKRNQVVAMLSNREVQNGYGIANLPSSSYAAQSAEDHHIAQVSTVKADGSRYIFGLPAYNYMKKEVSFAVGQKLDGSQLINYPNAPDCQTGLITYGNGDNSLQNGWGVDNYFNAVTTPAYAHAYMLTAVLSSDYVDSDGIKGPSDGDLGSYTRFDYKQVSDFKWRIPASANKASYNEGLKADPQDDKANYLYGEKELWYLDKIETPNYIAIFHSSDRDDACSVAGEDGGLNTAVTMQKLDKISLYTKQDYVANGTAATPIKEVHFKYDYSLCPNVPNQRNYNASTLTGPGKLTLKKVYFTYRDSYRGKYSPYTFQYADTDFDQTADVNFPYNLRGYDRWGGYQPNVPSNCQPLSPLGTAEYPYTPQDRSQQDLYAAAWHLTSINLPSGGQVRVTYEADDYGFVQHKRAMQMHKIIGVGNTPTAIDYGGDNDIEDRDPVTISSPSNKNEYLFFELQDQTTPISEYFKGVDDLYFRCLMEYNKNGQALYDYVSGYAKVKQGTEQIVTITNPNTGQAQQVGVVQLMGVSRSDNGPADYNPIAIAGVQFGRLSLSRIVWDQSNIDESQGFGLALLNSLGNTLLNFGSGLKNPNVYQYDQGQGIKLVTNKSWLRLNNVTGSKLGGGSRVKRLTMHDNWAQMTANAEDEFYYGQDYEYTTEVNGKAVSSGVATYEPLVGGDENPWRQPIAYSEQLKLAPDHRFFQEAPFGEMFMPNPSVGYSKVTIKNIERTNVTRHATGKVVHEFYTAKDYPVVLQRTKVEHPRHKNDPFSIATFFNIDSKDHMTASQGFSVELNDMHGKPKAQYNYPENSATPISSMYHLYEDEPYLAGSRRLTNEATIVQPDGTVEPGEIGVFFDMVADFREQRTVMNSPTLHINLEGFWIAFVYVLVPPVFGTNSRDETQFRSATTTKVVQRFGRLKETIAMDRGSKVSTKNLAYDAVTGNVLLTQVVNNFDDPVYAFNYPAHWYYSGMGASYRNINMEGEQLTFSGSGVATFANAKRYFHPGDELAINSGSGLHWITDVSNNSITVVDKAGMPLVGQHDIKVIRSGFRNRLDAMMGSIMTLTNPLDGLGSNLYENVLSAGVTEFSERWNTYCDCFTDVNGDPSSTNPYFTGEKGNHRPVKSYSHLTGRSQSLANGNSNLRKDGVFTSYQPFYRLQQDKTWGINKKNWTFVSEVTELNPYGLTMESKDALGNYDAVLYSYNQTLAVSTGANAQHQELGFDSFEDYDAATCADQHFRLDDGTYNLSTESAHSGYTSVKVPAGAPAVLTRYLPGYDCHPEACTLELLHAKVTDPTTGSQVLQISPAYGVGTTQVSYNVISGTPAINFNGATNEIKVEMSSSYRIEVTATDANGCSVTQTYKVKGLLLVVGN